MAEMTAGILMEVLLSNGSPDEYGQQGGGWGGGGAIDCQQTFVQIHKYHRQRTVKHIYNTLYNSNNIINP